MNLIVITSDELRADACGFMGNPDCRTPNLDRFADKGVVFTNHFTPHSKCVPSRVAMMTGRYCHTDGIRAINEECHLPPGAPSIIDPLKAAGYETAYFGHNHVWQDFWGDNTKGSGCVDYHSFTEGVFRPLLDREWPVPPGESVPADPGAPNLRVQCRVEPLTFFCDDNRVEQAIHYLREVRDRSKPFFMQLNTGKPHPSYDVEEPYFSMYDRDSITPWEHDLPENAPLPLRAMRDIRTGTGTEPHFRELQAVYYGMVTKVDALLGRLFAVMDEDNLWDDTVVLYTTDHGDFAGQFGLPEKWDTLMHDCLMRAPTILWAPTLEAGRRVNCLSDHTDLVPTLLGLLGLEADWGVHGTSLLPAIAGAPVRTAVFADGGHEAAMRARFSFPGQDKDGFPATHGKQQTYHDVPDAMARTKMIRTDRWKLVIREIEDHELYDLESDPGELTNVYGQPGTEEITSELMLQLLQWCLRTDTDRPYVGRVGA